MTEAGVCQFLEPYSDNLAEDFFNGIRPLFTFVAFGMNVGFRDLVPIC